MAITREQILTNPIFAGNVKRYSTWPTIQQQTVGGHSFNCLLIWLRLYGPPAPRVTEYFLWHDLGELVLGDLPFPVKAKNPDLKKACDEVEKAAVKEMGGPDFELTDLLKIRMKLVDLLEMYTFGTLELVMGNKFGQPIVDDIGKAVLELVKKLPPEDRKAIAAYVKGVDALLES